MLALWISPPSTAANPSGALVTHGEVEFFEEGGVLSAMQSSEKAIIEWDSFSIAPEEIARFSQPGADSAALNRVTGGMSSSIDGVLQANGHLILLNPNGILVGPSGRIDAASFLASTLDLADGDFLAGGDQHLSGPSDAAVVNLGTINAIGGDVFLIGARVENAGTVSASEGTVGLAAGTDVEVLAVPVEGERVFVKAAAASGSKVENTGTIDAATAELKAHGNAYAMAVDNGGLIRATGVERRGGQIFLTAGGGGGVANRGTLRATDSVGNGGRIAVVADRVENAGVIDASSDAAGASGGDVRVMAREISLALGSQVRADGDRDGGRVDLSGGEGGGVTLGGLISARGKNGAGGEVRIGGESIELAATAMVDVSGAAGGGAIHVGGGPRGESLGDEWVRSKSVTVVQGASLVAASSGGDGGEVVLWADGEMIFEGEILAAGREVAGENETEIEGEAAEVEPESTGGFAEVSGLERLNFLGTVDTGGGSLLLDPFSYTIEAPEAAAIVGALGSNHVTIDTTSDAGALGSTGNAANAGDITVNSNLFYDSSYDLTLLAVGDVNFNASVQNRSAVGGDVNVVAGWDGVTAFDTASYLAEDVTATTVFGNGGGSVHVGDGTQLQSIAVGSRMGYTRLFGYDVQLKAGYEPGFQSLYANVGFPIESGLSLDGENLGIASEIRGDLTLRAAHDLVLSGGDDGFLGYSHIGHKSTSGDSNYNPQAVLEGGIDIAIGNDLMASGGGDSSNYVQIGHGGARARAKMDGDISVSVGGDVTFRSGKSYVALGNVGRRGRFAGNVSLNGNRNDSAFVSEGGGMVGNGGSVGTTTGNIHVSGFESFRFPNGGLVGHGTEYASGNTTTGNISLIDIGEITFGTVGGGGQIGHAGRRVHKSGDISLENIGELKFFAGAGSFAGAQLGHGDVDFDGDASGEIRLKNVGAIQFEGGSGTGASAQLGHGGRGYVSVSSHLSGDVILEDIGGLVFRAGDGWEASAQLGHGGNGRRGNQDGNIQLTRVGDLEFYGGSGIETSAQLGHGGYQAIGDRVGSILLHDVGDLKVSAGEGRYSYAQIGHGGSAAKGNNTGDVNLSIGGELLFRGGGGGSAYAQLGHGGENADGDHSGNISVSKFDDVTFLSSIGSVAYAQLGNGGFSAGGRSDGEIVLSGVDDVTFSALGGGISAYAQLGHGGLQADGDFSGNIEVRHTGDLVLTGNGIVIPSYPRYLGYSRIGHGDDPTDGDFGNVVDGDILVESAGRVTLEFGFIGHEIDDDGGYASGDTFVGARSLTLDAESTIGSAPSGELRFYLAGRSGYQIEEGALLNDSPAVSPGTLPLPNEQGRYAFGNGPYDLLEPVNYAFYFAPPHPIVPIASSAHGQALSANSLGAAFGGRRRSQLSRARTGNAADEFLQFNLFRALAGPGYDLFGRAMHEDDESDGAFERGGAGIAWEYRPETTSPGSSLRVFGRPMMGSEDGAEEDGEQ